MEFPEDQRSDPRGEPRAPDARPARAQDHETEAWLRRELAFLHGVERRILRRERMRREAWRAAAVALILAVFSCCWYLAALGGEGSAPAACPATSPRSASAAAVPGMTTHAHPHAVTAADATASGCSS